MMEMMMEMTLDEEIRFRHFARPPSQMATAADAHLPLHIQCPPVKHLSWERATEIVLEGASPDERQFWETLTAPYRNEHEAAKMFAERDVSKTWRGEAILYGDDMELMLKARFAREVADELVVDYVRLLQALEERATGSRRRVLGWPPAWNEAERRAIQRLKKLHGEVPFATAASTRELGARHSFAFSIDFKKFYQQFILLTWRYFAFRHAGKSYALASIPTGAAAPPIFAQVLARAIIALAIRRTGAQPGALEGDCMIDNLRITSNDLALLQCAFQHVMSICEFIGITVGDINPPAPAASAPYTYLGLHFSDVVRPSEKIREKLRKFKHLLRRGVKSAADASAGFGVCLFAAQASGTPLSSVYHVVKYIRRLGHKAARRRNWSLPADVWPCVVDQWCAWIDRLRSASYKFHSIPSEARFVTRNIPRGSPAC
jgi:hypothetical protein